MKNHTPKKSYQRKPKRKSDPIGVEALLKDYLASRGLDKKLIQYQFVKDWSKIVGEELAQRTAPLEIRGHCLYIRVESSIWAQELNFRKNALLSRLQKYLGPRHKGKVTNLFFRVTYQ